MSHSTHRQRLARVLARATDLTYQQALEKVVAAADAGRLPSRLDAAGMQRALSMLIAGQQHRESGLARALPFAVDLDGTTLHLTAGERSRLLITGRTGGGKSWTLHAIAWAAIAAGWDVYLADLIGEHEKMAPYLRARATSPTEVVRMLEYLVEQTDSDAPPRPFLLLVDEATYYLEPDPFGSPTPAAQADAERIESLLATLMGRVGGPDAVVLASQRRLTDRLDREVDYRLRMGERETGLGALTTGHDDPAVGVRPLDLTTERDTAETTRTPVPVADRLDFADPETDETTPPTHAGVDPARLVIALRRLATLLDAGLSLPQAVPVLVENEKDATLCDTFVAIRAALYDGATLEHALRAHPGVFAPWMAVVLHTSDSAGRLIAGLRSVADTLEAEIRTSLLGA